MCKPIDECDTPRREATQLHHPPALKNNKKKRVRFRAADIIEFERVTAPKEKQSVWYNREEFQEIRAEIGEVVKARAANDWRVNDEDFYCLRGLEFLKLDHNTPSRKERRLRYAKNVLVYQVVVNRKKVSKEEAIRDFCTKLSQAATQRAQALASLDETDARQVYLECRLIYQVDGKDMNMFGANRSSLCRRQSEDYSPLQEVFSYDSLIRVITTMRSSSTTLFATRVA